MTPWTRDTRVSRPVPLRTRMQRPRRRCRRAYLQEPLPERILGGRVRSPVGLAVLSPAQCRPTAARPHSATRLLVRLIGLRCDQPGDDQAEPARSGLPAKSARDQPRMRQCDKGQETGYGRQTRHAERPRQRHHLQDGARRDPSHTMCRRSRVSQSWRCRAPATAPAA